MDDENCAPDVAITQQAKHAGVRVNKSPLKPVNDVLRLMHTAGDSTDKTPVNSPLFYIRQLDSAERWKERNCIITKQSHLENLDTARSILVDVINGLNVYDQHNTWMSEASVVGDNCPLPPPPVVPPVVDEVETLAAMLGGLNMASNTPKRPVPELAGDCKKEDDHDDSFHSAADEVEMIEQDNHDEEAANDCISQSISGENIDVPINIEENKMLSEPTSSENPFKTRSQLVNSPDTQKPISSENVLPPSEQMEPHHYGVDSLKPTHSERNSSSIQPIPLKGGEVDPKKETHQLVEEQKSPSKSVCENIGDPFIPKNQILNSPITDKSTEDMPDQSCVVDSKDPFVPKTQILNSPVNVPSQNCEDLKAMDDPFAPRNQIVNSPIGKESSQPTNELNLNNVVDPFASKTQILNSPIGNFHMQSKDSQNNEEAEQNPVVPKTQIVNSPVMQMKVSLNTNDIESEFSQNDEEAEHNPFVPKTQIVNSPDMQPRVCLKTENIEMSSDPKKQMTNSHEEGNLGEREKVVITKVESPCIKSPSTKPLESTSETGDLASADNSKDIMAVCTPESITSLTDEADEPVKVDTTKEDLLSTLPASNKVSKEYKPTLETGDLATDQASEDILSVCPPELITSMINETQEPAKVVFMSSPSTQHASLQMGDLASGQANEDILTVCPPELVTSMIDETQEPIKIDTTKELPSTQPASNKTLEDCKPTPEIGSVASSDASEEIIAVCPPDLVTSMIDKTQEPAKEDNVIQSKNQNNEDDRDLNPFACKKQIPNSPVESMKAISPKHKDIDLDQNPFISKSQIPNSPLQNHEKDINQSQSQIAQNPPTDTPRNSEVEQNPLPTNKITNSPGFDGKLNADESKLNASKTRTQKPNFPPTADVSRVPNNSSSKLENCSETDCIQDPLKTKSVIANAPVNKSKNEDEEHVPKDPFKSQKIENSPVNKCETRITDDSKEDPFKSKNQIPNSPTNSKTISEEDPFKPKKQMMNSPKVEVSKELIISPAMQTSDESKAMQVQSLFEKEKREVPAPSSSVVSANEASSQLDNDNLLAKTTSAMNSETPGVDSPDQEIFIPAEQAFNDADFFDMLEKAGQDSDDRPAKRGSLLLKFDPLQERRDTGVFLKPLGSGPVPKQRPVPTFSANASLAEESVCLFGTPPKVQRRRTITRNIHNRSIVASIEEENNGTEVDMIMALDGEASNMPFVLSENMSESSGAQLVEITQMPKYTDADMTQMKNELSLKFQEMVMTKDKDFQEKLQGKEREFQEKEKEFQEVLAQKEKDLAAKDSEVKALEGKVKVQQGKLKSLREVLNEFRDITAELTDKNEKAAKDADAALKERQALFEDNKTLEKSFDDLYKRYEKMKTSLNATVTERESLVEKVTSANAVSMKSKEAFTKLKETAEAKLAEQVEKHEKLENTMKAALKHKDMKIQKLEVTLETKVKENKELTDLCDSLIQKAESG